MFNLWFGNFYLDVMLVCRRINDEFRKLNYLKSWKFLGTTKIESFDVLRKLLNRKGSFTNDVNWEMEFFGPLSL